MYPSIRQSKMLERLRLQQFCNITELDEFISVSDETVRRDVRQLAEMHLVRKVHRGVASLHETIDSHFQKRKAEQREEKQQIAEICSVLIPDGTTTSYVARFLAKYKDLTVITNSTNIAGILLPPSGNHVYMPGGEVRQDDGAIFGQSAVE